MGLAAFNRQREEAAKKAAEDAEKASRGKIKGENPPKLKKAKKAD